MTWARGRRLASAETGGHEVSYQYDSNGLRVSKMVDGDLHEYYYYGNMLVYETMPGPYADGVLSTIEFMFDADGNPTGIRYFNGLSTFRYYFVKNLQGDIVQLQTWENGYVADSGVLVHNLCKQQLVAGENQAGMRLFL